MNSFVVYQKYDRTVEKPNSPVIFLVILKASYCKILKNHDKLVLLQSFTFFESSSTYRVVDMLWTWSKTEEEVKIFKLNALREPKQNKRLLIN